tara:strand:- start:604 stop:1803 length:1200 start_codon:yes stop_codon:yes gene_type:complete
MALTKISTDGVKDDAITKAKIPADQIEASELANNAVDTNAIQDDAVIQSKIAAGAVNTTELANSAVNNAKLASNSVTGAKIASLAVTANKIGAGEITNTHIGTGAINGDRLTDETVTLAKLPHGDSNNDGKFLRANNGADPSFESIPAGTTINNNANYRVITGDANSDELNAETRLTFNGSLLTVSGGNDDNPLILNTDNGNGAHMRFQQQGSTKHYLGCGGGIGLGDANDLTMRSTDDIHFATGNVSTLKWTIDQDGAVQIPFQPSFAAKHNHNGDVTWNNMAKFPFNVELFDRGSDYNNSTYIFTAPVSGIYQINFHTIIRYNVTNAQPALRKNGSTFYRTLSSFSWQSGTSNYDNMNFSVLMQLSSNDYIDVINASGYNLTVHGGEYAGFSAYLVA